MSTTEQLELFRELAQRSRARSRLTAREAIDRGALFEIPLSWSQEAGSDLPVRVSRRIYRLAGVGFGALGIPEPKSQHKHRIVALLRSLRRAIDDAEGDSTEVFFDCKLGRTSTRCLAYVDTSWGLAVHVLANDDID